MQPNNGAQNPAAQLKTQRIDIPVEFQEVVKYLFREIIACRDSSEMLARLTFDKKNALWKYIYDKMPETKGKTGMEVAFEKKGEVEVPYLNAVLNG